MAFTVCLPANDSKYSCDFYSQLATLEERRTDGQADGHPGELMDILVFLVIAVVVWGHLNRILRYYGTERKAKPVCGKS